jgi:Mn-dependent DtxR family transcriptional regulator
MAEIQKEIMYNPEYSAGRIARKLGVDWISVNKALISLDKHGLYSYKKK